MNYYQKYLKYKKKYINLKNMSGGACKDAEDCNECCNKQVKRCDTCIMYPDGMSKPGRAYTQDEIDKDYKKSLTVQ